MDFIAPAMVRDRRTHAPSHGGIYHPDRLIGAAYLRTTPDGTKTVGLDSVSRRIAISLDSAARFRRAGRFSRRDAWDMLRRARFTREANAL